MDWLLLHSPSNRFTRTSTGHQLFRGLLFLETALAVAISMAANLIRTIATVPI